MVFITYCNRVESLNAIPSYETQLYNEDPSGKTKAEMWGNNGLESI